jgi:hypothetical protein
MQMGWNIFCLKHLILCQSRCKDVQAWVFVKISPSINCKRTNICEWSFWVRLRMWCPFLLRVQAMSSSLMQGKELLHCKFDILIVISSLALL